MSNLGISSGLKALLAAQASLDTIGNNLANVNTPGYSRQRVDLGSSPTINRYGLRVGSGVDTLGISRSIDELLQRRMYNALGGKGRIEAAYAAMSGVEAAFGELTGNGIGDGLDGFYAAASALAGSPADSILQNDLVEGGKSIVERFRQVVSGLSGSGAALNGEIEDVVREVNALAERLADVNGQIAGFGGTPNSLLDERDRLVSELAELVDIQETVDQNGNHHVFAGSSLIVAGDRSMPLETFEKEDGKLGVRPGGTNINYEPKGGALAGLLALQGNQLGTLDTQLDVLAQSLILNTNRAHSTGLPASGSFQILRGTNQLEDVNGSGTWLDDPIGEAGLPFDVQEGQLVVNVVDETTGDVETQTIDIDPNSTTVAEFVDSLNSIDNLRSWVDSNGYLVVEASTGFGFDFSNRVDPNPDQAGTFGSSKAMLGSAESGPYSLTPGATLDFASPAGSGAAASVAFPAGTFDDFGDVSAEELADVLNQDAGFSGLGLEAHVVAGHLHVGTLDGGPSQSFEITGGAAASELGFAGAVGQTIAGSDLDSKVTISGEYSGEASTEFVFQVVGEGTVGTTEGLTAEVYDADGGLVATLDLGPDYTPGESIEFVDGLEVSFGLGELSESSGDRFATTAVADSDSSDVLVALGLNSFFVGSSAATIDVREDLVEDPSLVSTSTNGTAGGNGAILAMVDAEDAELGILDGRTLAQAYSELIGDIGYEVGSLEGALESSDVQVRALQERRDAVSGVNTDEELVDLVRFEQSYAAAAQYLSVVSQLEEELLQIL